MFIRHALWVTRACVPAVDHRPVITIYFKTVVPTVYVTYLSIQVLFV